MGARDVSLLLAGLGLFSDRPQTPQLKHKRRGDNNCFTAEAFLLLCAGCQQKEMKISKCNVASSVSHKILSATHVFFFYGLHFAKNE